MEITVKTIVMCVFGLIQWICVNNIFHRNIRRGLFRVKVDLFGDFEDVKY